MDESGIYECPSEYPYIDLSGDKVRCTTSSACTASNYIFSDGPLNECTSAKKCTDGGYFLEKTQKKCMTAYACSQLSQKHYAYDATGECSTAAPDEDGGFDEGAEKKNRYACAPDAVLDLVSPKRRCVSSQRCVYTETAGIVTSARTCVDRDAWLRENDGNVANVFSAEALGPGDVVDDPAQICVNRLEGGFSPVRGAVLLDGRVCVCSGDASGAFLDVRSDELACVAAPNAFDEDALGFVLSFAHAGEVVEMRVLMNSTLCGEIGGYVSADVRECVFGCPEGEFALEGGVCAKECASMAFAVVSASGGAGSAKTLQNQCVEAEQCGKFYSERVVVVNGAEEVYRQCYAEKCPENDVFDPTDATETCQTAEKCAARGKLVYGAERLCVSLEECVGEMGLFVGASGAECVSECSSAAYEVVSGSGSEEVQENDAHS